MFFFHLRFPEGRSTTTKFDVFVYDAIQVPLFFFLPLSLSLSWVVAINKSYSFNSLIVSLSAFLICARAQENSAWSTQHSHMHKWRYLMDDVLPSLHPSIIVSLLFFPSFSHQNDRAGITSFLRWVMKEEWKGIKRVSDLSTSTTINMLWFLSSSSFWQDQANMKMGASSSSLRRRRRSLCFSDRKRRVSPAARGTFFLLLLLPPCSFTSEIFKTKEKKERKNKEPASRNAFLWHSL